MTALIYTLIVTHITIICVTIFLHRGQAHRGLIFSPILSHFMRFWLWLTTGMSTKEWVAIHRKHHKDCDLKGDPHSPLNHGILKVLFGGAFLYAKARKDREMIEQFGVGTPDDWLEKHVYAEEPYAGITLMLIINLLLFGLWGVVIWLVQMLWIPFWAAGVVNGIGHWWGYRNGNTKDNSRNIVPFGIIIGGEELHNNHHLDPANPRLRKKWFELDMGYIYIQLFRVLGLLKLRNSP